MPITGIGSASQVDPVASLVAALNAATAALTASTASSLQKSNNLSDLVSAATARTNLGLGSLDSTYVRQRAGRGDSVGVFDALAGTLAEGKSSCGLTVLGDSTGYTAGKTRWVPLFADWLAALYPAYAVQIATWDAVSAYGTPTVLTGTPTARSVTSTGASGLRHSGDGTAVTGDIDVRVKVSVPAWPLASTSALAGRMSASAGNYSWAFLATSTGRLQLQWSADGTNLLGTGLTSQVLTVTPGTAVWLRAVLVVATGVVTFYQPSTDGVTWAVDRTQTLSATSINDPGANADYSVGGYGTNNSRMAGTFYECMVIPASTGQSVVPRYLDAWGAQNTVTDSQLTYAGKPVLTIMNGSWPAKSLSDLSNATNLVNMTPFSHNPMARIISLSHNDGNLSGPSYLSSWASFITALRARESLSPIALTIQNPRIAGMVASTESHHLRLRQLRAWARIQNLSVIDVARAYAESGITLAGLLDVDGLHPNDSLGSPLWAAVVESAFANSGLY
jgi:hypothetical protein